ncbi:hypothetical protein B0H11DRAFT_2384646 [Mycena galericulata]|nr:hypothetical protein B0H11DRAFT_2384646 [Mycena galericulata]
MPPHAIHQPFLPSSLLTTCRYFCTAGLLKTRLLAQWCIHLVLVSSPLFFSTAVGCHVSASTPVKLPSTRALGCHERDDARRNATRNAISTRLLSLHHHVASPRPAALSSLSPSSTRVVALKMCQVASSAPQCPISQAGQDLKRPRNLKPLKRGQVSLFILKLPLVVRKREWYDLMRVAMVL